MKIKIVRIDKTLPLPEYKSAGAAAFDVYAREETVIPAKATGVVPTNLILGTPEGYFMLFASRSGSFKKGFTLANGTGILDSDFRGPNDEVQLPLYNFTDKDITIIRGERFAQALIIPIEKAEWEEVDLIGENSRGRFGSTGNF